MGNADDQPHRPVVAHGQNRSFSLCRTKLRLKVYQGAFYLDMQYLVFADQEKIGRPRVARGNRSLHLWPPRVMGKLNDCLDRLVLAAVPQADRPHRKQSHREVVANAGRERACGRPVRAPSPALDEADKRLADASELTKALLRDAGGSAAKTQLATEPAQEGCGAAMAFALVLRHAPSHALNDAGCRLSLRYQGLIAIRL
jgi:hypothetical protein